MTDAQIFQLLGLAYVVMGLRGVINKDPYKDLLDGYASSPALLFLTGLVALTVGFLLVTFHNEWSMSWSVIITIFGWLALIKGALILAVPEFFLKMSGAMQKGRKFFRAYAVFVLLLGVLFLLLGFGVL